MVLRIDGAAKTAPDPSSSGWDADVPTPSGSWRGETVQVQKADCDVIGDAAEEITFEHSERVENSKLEEREVDVRPEVDVPLVEQIQEYLEAAGKDDLMERLRQFATVLAQRADSEGGLDGASAREEAQRRFGGATEQFLALSFAVNTLGAEGRHGQLVSELHSALRGLQDEYGGHIRADLNTIDVASAYGQGDAASVEHFQAGYRDAVLTGSEQLGGLLGATLQRFGTQDYRRAVTSMIEALGADLHAVQGSSVPRERLDAILQQLYQMEVLNTALDGCQALARRVREAGGPAVDAGKVLQDLVGLAGERWANADRYTELAERHGARDVQSRIQFLSNAKQIVGALPPKVFADTDARNNAKEAVQDAFAAAIDLEDSE